jgi:hypothetical protein
MPQPRVECLSLPKRARLFAALHGQFTFKNGETLDQRGMAMFADDPCPDTCKQFGDHAVLGILVGKLKKRDVLPRHGIFPDLADLDRRAVRRRVRVRMRHENNASLVGISQGV